MPTELPPHLAEHKARKRTADKLNSLETTGLTAAQRTAVDALTAVSTANATDLTTAVALANANKTKINAIIAALKAT